jgi:hypothetical protein
MKLLRPLACSITEPRKIRRGDPAGSFVLEATATGSAPPLKTIGIVVVAAFATSAEPIPLHEEFKRRIKTQTALPSADTAAMLFWALLASGQKNKRKVDGWQSLTTKPIDQPIDLAA